MNWFWSVCGDKMGCDKNANKCMANISQRDTTIFLLFVDLVRIYWNFDQFVKLDNCRLKGSENDALKKMKSNFYYFLYEKETIHELL